MKISKLLILGVIVVAISTIPVMADTLNVVSGPTSADPNLTIIGVYNKAQGTSSFVDLSSTPISAFRAYEPAVGGYPNVYLDPTTDGTNSMWDAAVSGTAALVYSNTGADWIWETEHSEGPTAGGALLDADPSGSGRVVVFEKKFNIRSNWAPASSNQWLAIAADNCYEVWVNGTHVARSLTCIDGWQDYDMMKEDVVSWTGWENEGVYDIASLLTTGENTIKIMAGNEYHGYTVDVTTGVDNWFTTGSTNDTSNSPIPAWLASPYRQLNPGAMIFALVLNYEVLTPDIDIEKYVSVDGGTTWDDADSAPGPSATVGDTVMWRYEVENTGQIPLTGVDVWDDNGTDGVPGDDWQPTYVSGDGGVIGTMEVGEIWIYEASGTVVAGQYTNWADVTTDQGAYDEDPANYYGEEVPGDQGCTPGFWKNNAEKKGAVAWYCYLPDDDFSEVFDIDETVLRDKGKKVFDNPTLLQALNANGSGVNLMARAAVAALLNACNPNVAYPMSASQIIAAVQDAVAMGEEQALGEELDYYNNLGCPINQKGEPILY